MTGWIRSPLFGAIAAAGAIVLAAAAYFGLPYLQKKAPATSQTAVVSSTSPNFTKGAYQVDSSGNLVRDSNGDPVPFTGTVQPGDQIEYVLTYKPPATGSTGAITIKDTLSGNQSYVNAPPSLVTPPGWTPATGSTSPVPYGTGNQQTYSNPAGISAGDQVGAILNVTPYSGAVGQQASGGDGFIPIPINTANGKHVYAVNHHLVPGMIMCWQASDLSACPGSFPKASSFAASKTIATATSPRAAIVGSKFYYAAAWYDPQNSSNGMAVGLGCWDTTADQPCAPIPAPGAPGLTTVVVGNSLSAYIAGAEADPANPSHVLMFAVDRFYCIDVATSAACSGWPATPPALSGITTVVFHDLIVEEGGTRVFVSDNSGRIYCAALSDGSTCVGWPAAGAPTNFAGSLNLGPLITATSATSATMTGICLFHSTSASQPVCLDDTNGSVITDPTWSAAGWSSFAGGFANKQVVAAYHIPGTARVLYPHNSQIAQPHCYDFWTQSACAPFSPYWNSSAGWTDANNVLHGSTRDYGFGADPDNPAHCIYGLGDGGLLVRFGQDGQLANSACSPKDYHATASILDNFCAFAPKHATWTTANVVLAPGDTETVKGTLTITDSAGNTQTVAVDTTNGVSYPVNMAATGPGANVTITFSPDSPAAQPYQITLSYSADADPQICYKTTVKDCTETLTQGPVTNTAVYTDANGTNQASINLGNVTGGHCGPPPCLLDLTGVVTMNPDGTGTLTVTGSGPPGFDPHILTLHSNTAGVAVTPPTRTIPSGPINATFVLTGIAPGQSIDIQIDAVDPGAGTNGSDKCCSSTITVVVPDEHEHHQHTDVAIQKTGASEGQGPANGSGYIYTLSVTNVSDPITGANNIVVTDVVPAGLSFASASGTDWNCVGPFPIGAGGTLTCTYTGTGTVATGQTLPPITVVSTNATPGAQLPSVTNCARVALAASSGLTDYQPSNDQSCITNDAHSQMGSLTVIKTVVPARGHPVPPISFQANAICTPLGGSPTTTALTLGSSNNYTQAIPNLTAGTVCTISETPPSPTGLAKECHWVTTYPDGQQATIPAGTVTAHIVNTEVCGDTTTADTIVRITKRVIIDGRVSYPAYQSFSIRAMCRKPDGASLDLSYTASSAAGFSSPRQKVTRGAKCTIREPLPPPPAGRDHCHWATSYVFNGRPVRSFPVTLANRPENAFEVENVLTCEQTQPQSQTQIQTETTDRCPAPGHWNGKRCVTCEGAATWNAETGTCRAQPISCQAPMEPDAAGISCMCPKNTKLKDGKCQKSGSILDNVFDHVTIGIGPGSRSHGGDARPHGDK